MLIENVIGLHTIDGVHRNIHWNLQYPSRTGIRNLAFADITTSMVAEAGKVEVHSSGDYTLSINGRDYPVTAGTHQFML